MKDTKSTNPAIVITHPGVFHADDVVAAAILNRRAKRMGGSIKVERRIPTPEEINDDAIIVFDVGGEYNVKTNTFDHHQRGGAGARWDDDGAPYSSAGLIWSHFGIDECNGVDGIWSYVENTMIKPIDRLDNGAGVGGDFSFSKAISLLNPGPQADEDRRQECFEVGMLMAEATLNGALQSGADFVHAKLIVDKAVSDNQLLILPKYATWEEHIVNRPDYEDLLYVVYPSLRGGHCVQQIPVEPGSFEGRKPLPEEWAGLRGEELQKLLGLKESGDATFCHPGRFIGGAQTIDDTLKMALMAVRN